MLYYEHVLNHVHLICARTLSSMEKQYNHRQIEQQMRDLWNAEKVYQVTHTTDSLVSIDTPPPTVSGALHIGHIFSYTQTDIIARFRRMCGEAVFYPFGFDDNGLPTERFVEKKRGVSSHTMTRAAFIELCLEETVAVEAVFKSLWQRMGLSVDWDFCYETISPQVRALSQRSFIRLLQKDMVYRKDEPSLYCTACRTTVAQAELDDVEQSTVFYDITFQSEDGVPLLIATTRPELLASCVALLYHPDDIRYQALQGKTARVPLFGYMVPILADALVVPSKGSGLVMCCTFGDSTDVLWYKKHGLTYRPSIGRDGRWVAETGILAGCTAKQARERVVIALTDAGHIHAHKAVVHTVNVHERCKNPIEFLVLPQWFLKLLPYKDEFIALADRIQWYPAFMKSRYVHWVKNITWDWCLSRQRFFGIPFPVWHCVDCSAVLTAPETLLPVDPQERPWEGTCTTCGGSVIVPDGDVMDTWNTSSLTPYICESIRTGETAVFDRPFTPMAIRPQAHDIIRTWAFYTIVKVWMHHGTIPWHTVVVSGHVLSGAHEKLSKSRGNSTLDPEQLLERYSADAIRYWTASATLGHDIAFSEAQLQAGNRLVIKLWNAFRFIAEHSMQAMQEQSLQQPTQVVNRWIIHAMSVAHEQYTFNFSRYEPSLALDVVERLFWNDLCDNYLELIKDQLFHPERYDAATVSETGLTLRRVGIGILQLYAPYVPYVTEALYQAIYRDQYKYASIHRTHFREIQCMSHDTVAASVMEMVLRIVAQARRLKSERQVALRTDIAQLTLYAPREHREFLAHQEQLIAGVTRAASVVWSEEDGVEQLEQRDNTWYMSVVVLR